MNDRALKVWREGFAPELSIESLEYLRLCLRNDDAILIQGATTLPGAAHGAKRVKGGCAIGVCGIGAGLETVSSVEAFFARVCYAADQRLRDVAACRWFLTWVDDTPRAEMRRELLAEVERELANRKTSEPIAEACPVGLPAEFAVAG